ncbi:DUF3570 domain-containing protein [Flagellatimonas centrodinii]|uniref:DUF3570 domain-containing protein n=1 Tax=Flagellatimonas centrodinii TaxID=2806210 RepID=UPI001FEE2524|nr:DUF3570 domain-containing protein [Flagellatimonas centrodinii]ULQ46400.1 DUF3570 domain-containing protein [Flagellatimonas centrodinii]
MQLKKTNALGAAALTLLGGTSTAQAEDRGWVFDTATLIYSELDGRVSAVEPKLRATKTLANDRSFSVGATVDVLAGASPNGAIAADTPQTFSRPSGTGQYTTAPGELPLDDTFQDTRIALDGSFTLPVGKQTLTTSLSASNEYDYLSLAAGAVVSRDFNQRNTTVSVGANLASDTIDAVGGAPVPLSIMPAPGQPTGRAEASEDKQIVDLLVSVTQILSPQSLMQISYSLSQSDGYLNDPYKIISVVDGNGDPLRYAYEGRPETRVKHALFAQYKRFVFDRDVLDISFRLLTDDWGIGSQTLDMTYRWNFSAARYLEPHVRYYRQSAADFYRIALFDGEENQLEFASADPRLGQFDAVTLGLKYGQTLKSGNEWNLRLEGYTQQGSTDGVPSQAATALAGRDLDPTLDAVMLTAGYRFRW